MPPILQKQNDNTKYNRINQIYEMLKNKCSWYDHNRIIKRT